ncbi:MAG: hypothetical protein ABI672_13990 [Vicinamibacteria bacterium]
MTATMTTELLGLQPFVPSGPDFEGARALFRDLGFKEMWSGGDYVGFQQGAARFILQKYNDAHFASNLMIRIDVPNVDAWYAEVAALSLPAKHKGLRINPPKDFSWGREVHFIDPAGVCWHVGAV